jgi:hypothetical protein
VGQQQAYKNKSTSEGHNETVYIHDLVLKLWLYPEPWIQLIQSLYYPGTKLKSTQELWGDTP